MTDGTTPPPEEPGYWERKAAEEAAAATPSPYPAPDPNPAPGAGNPYGNPYENPYGGQPASAPAPPGWAPQPGVPGFPGYALPDHPRATSAFVVGLIALGGTFVCGVPILASPVAWIMGAQARKEIRSAPQQWGGESKATAGMVLGIIGTVLLVVLVLAVIVVIALAVSLNESAGT